ncbi:hypothetical protein [Bacillus cereus group sp. RP43]|uniref:hypothetical protein n=1 Tax=Bacillus cereus group sp. RP43 TaxID=3040260 RepID=UPI0033914BA2
MKQVLKEITDLLMYKGPNLQELLTDALNEKKEVSVEKRPDMHILKVQYTIPYNIPVEECYFYNIQDELFKQTININGKSKVIFDKYAEISGKLTDLELAATLVS